MKSPKEIGKILRETRQKRGLTINEIYNKTRIQPNIIEALERGMADEVLSRVYVLLFLKKYASFLGLDGSSLAASYKTIYSGKAEEILDIGEELLAINIETQKKWITFALSGILILIFVFFILFLGIKLKSFYTGRKPLSPTAAKPPLKEAKSAKTIFPIPEGKAIELILRSTDDVWMKVKKDGEVVFKDTLRKNGKKKWSADNTIELWVGRAEALDFTINRNPIGSVGKGKIKSIQISRRGLKIGNKWLHKAKE